MVGPWLAHGRGGPWLGHGWGGPGWAMVVARGRAMAGVAHGGALGWDVKALNHPCCGGA